MFYFGPPAAGNDPDLLTYFHTTRQVKGLVLAHRIPVSAIFVARPGGGKTALVRWLEGAVQKRTCLFIRPTETHLTEKDADLNVEDYRILISAELYTAIISEIHKRGLVDKQLLKECKDYIGNSWYEATKTFFKERFEGLSILGSGFSLSSGQRQDYLRRIKRNARLSNVGDLLRRLAKQADVTLVVDDPEFLVSQGLDDVSADNAHRVGAFLSVLNQLHSLGIQVVVFVKEHILQAVQSHYRDFSHFEDRIDGLEWTDVDLLDMLKLRVEKRLKLPWGSVFALGEEAFKQEVFPHLINGPRDLIYICNTAGTSSEEKITKADIAKSIDALRASKWAEIMRQYSKQWPRIDEFAQTIIKIVFDNSKRGQVTRTKFRSAVESEFASTGSALHALRKEENWINTALWTSPTIEERLFLIGCLGYVYKGQRAYPWNGLSLERFRIADSFFISPLFV